MKTIKKKSAGVPKPQKQGSTAVKGMEIVFYLPVGAKISDVYMDGSQMAAEMHVSKGTIHNYRNSGKLPYSIFFGKIYYNRQLIAAMLAEAQQVAKKTPKAI